MKSIGPHEKKSQYGGFFADANSDRKGRADDRELLLDDLDAQKKSQPAWTFNSLAARMESISVSLWSWLVVGVLSAWFVIWLAEALSRLGSRIP